MIDSHGNRGYYARATAIDASTTGVRLNLDPLYLTTVGVLRAIAYAYTASGNAAAIRLVDGAGNNITNVITLPNTAQNRTLYIQLNDSHFVDPSKKYVQLGDVIAVNVTTAGTNFLFGLEID